MQERIGILGGTFDPVHYGHLRVAEEVRESLALSKIVFIPAYIQPLKDGSGSAEAAHRLQMARLATADNPYFEVDDCEICRGGASYTVDTLDHFRKTKKGARLFLIIGADAWANISLWREYERLFETAELVVMNRPGYEAAPIDKVLASQTASQFRREGDRYAYGKTEGGLRFVQVSRLDISGTAIRKKVSAGESIRYLTHPEVEKYIAKERLYA